MNFSAKQTLALINTELEFLNVFFFDWVENTISHLPVFETSPDLITGITNPEQSGIGYQGNEGVFQTLQSSWTSPLDAVYCNTKITF